MRYLVIILSLILVACGGEQKDAYFTKINPSIQFKIIHETKPGVKQEYIQVGDEITIHMKHMIGDSLLINTHRMKKPIKILVTEPLYDSDLMNAFLQLTEGDSAIIHLDADSYFNESHFEKPGFIHDGDQLIYQVRIEKVKTNSISNDGAKAVRQQLQQEMADIEKYANEQGYRGDFLQSKLYLDIYEKVDSAKTPHQGAELTVHYTGRFLNGDIFDSSVERGVPLSFELGKGHVIPGWDEGFKYLKEGERAIFIIPSYLAYGPMEKQNKIPGNSVLIFDVALIKIN